jgi:hypothetical protein
MNLIVLKLKNLFPIILISTFLFSLNTVPASAADENYFAGGGGDDGQSTEILWITRDYDVAIIDAGFDGKGEDDEPGVGSPATADAFDVFGDVWVRTGDGWYIITGAVGGVASGSRDENSSTFEAIVSRTVNSVDVTATLNIINNRAKWTVTTSAPVQQIAVLGNLGSDDSEVWYQKSTNVWWSNDGGNDSGDDPLLRFETSTGGTLRQNQSMPSDGLTGAGYEGTQSDELTGSDDEVIAISSANVSEFSLSVCIFDYTTGTFGGSGDTAARNAYIDGLNTENCGLTQTSSSPWVGAQSISCPAPNPWIKEQLGFASNAKPVLVSAENTIGKSITQGSYDALKSSGVLFDTVSAKVSTATETLPIYGCKDKLLSGKVNQPIQFIAGGYTLQSEAHGYINTADLKWHDTNGVTLYTNTAAFMHTIKFTNPGKYVVVLTEQPDTSRGLIPTYGVRSVRFVININ